MSIPVESSKETPPAEKTSKKAGKAKSDVAEAAAARLASTGRNELCPCGSGKKYKKCHLAADEQATAKPVVAPTAQDHVQAGWRLFEQRRPGAAEKEFRAALELDKDHIDARVGIGMARLQNADNVGARTVFEDVIKASEGVAAELEKKGVKDAFSRPEAQSYIRACHALGCLAYDEGKWAEALPGLERVYKVDEGPVGTEARLIAAKALMKLEKPADAVAVLEPIKDGKSAGGRAHMGLALARFVQGDKDGAKSSLAAAHGQNPYLGRAVLGEIRRRVDNPALAAQGSREEATLYAQTYGDVWTDEAKAFLVDSLEPEAG